MVAASSVQGSGDMPPMPPPPFLGSGTVLISKVTFIFATTESTVFGNFNKVSFT